MLKYNEKINEEPKNYMNTQQGVPLHTSFMSLTLNTVAGNETQIFSPSQIHLATPKTALHSAFYSDHKKTLKAMAASVLTIQC